MKIGLYKTTLKSIVFSEWEVAIGLTVLKSYYLKRNPFA